MNASLQCGLNVLWLSGWMDSIPLVTSGAMGVQFQSNLPLSSSYAVSLSLLREVRSMLSVSNTIVE